MIERQVVQDAASSSSHMRCSGPGLMSGQGRGRTVDLSIFKTPIIRSHLFATVLDLSREIYAVIGERPRTKANETGNETTREPQ
jgi:hypothetical protein